MYGQVKFTINESYFEEVEVDEKKDETKSDIKSQINEIITELFGETDERATKKKSC